MKKNWTFLLIAAVPLLLLGYFSWVMTVAPAYAGVSVDVGSHTADTAVVAAPVAATNWCVAGAFQGWDNASTPLNDDGVDGDLVAEDGVYSIEYTVAITGRYEWKAVACGNWGNAYPAENAWIDTSNADEVVRFTFDTNDHSGDAGWTLQPAQYIVNAHDVLPTSFTAVGDFQGWDNANPATMMRSVGDGIYHLAYQVITPTNYVGKVTATGSWDGFGADGRSVNAANIPFTTTVVSETVVFLLDTNTGQMTIANQGTSAGGNWCAAGAFQGWDNASTPLNDDGLNGDLLAGDNIYSTDYIVATVGRYEWKAVECGNWGNAYPAENAWLFTSVPSQTVKITFDTNDYSGDVGPTLYPTQNIVDVNDAFPSPFYAVGDWQSTPWVPTDTTTLLTDLGNGIHILTYTIATAGSYDGKVANDAWMNQVGADGRSINSGNISFETTEADSVVTFWLDGNQSRVGVIVPTPVVPPIDSSLVISSVQHPIQDEIFYFVLPDRFVNGDVSNDLGGIVGGPLDHGYLITDTGYYHGGDLSGLALTDTLDYIEGLGMSAIWLTPVFGNSPVQGGGTIDNSTAAYHGYWIIDYESADAHLGTDQELIDFVAAAHARGIKVFFDIVANHTGDIISYQEGQYTYRNKTDYPYEDINGIEFDDRAYVFSDTFPVLTTSTSFPYTPIVSPGDENIKNPNWLNNMLYYHNRGDSTFAGESSQYGDFFGLDDLFTERPEVLAGFIDIFTSTISTYDIDGYRIDTVKHVNTGFWQQLAPVVMAYAIDNGKPDFFMFGEVFDGNADKLSVFTTEGALPSVLDFGMQGNVNGFAVQSNPTDNLKGFFEADDYFTDADSNAYQLGNFISNHDIGRIGGAIRDTLGGSPDGEWLARTELGHALMYFARGFPIVYYGDEQGFVSDGGDQGAREDMFPSQVPSYNDNELIGTSATTADDNFDETHPIYETLADYATVRDAHLGLRRGAQIHRYSESGAGIYAFSRMERDEKVEYVVALNNATTVAQATFAVYSANMAFTAVYPLTSTDVITSDGSGMLTVTVPALDFVIYQASAPVTAVPEAVPTPTFNSPVEGEGVTGRVEVGVDLSESNRFVEVSFAVQIDGGAYTYIGTDNNPPYRLFYDVSGLAPGTSVTFQAIVDDLEGELANTVVTAVVDEESTPGDQQWAIIHYYRPDGDYGDYSSDDFNDFWGLHLWGDAIHPDEVTEWTAPKKFSGIDEYGAFVAIRIVDDTQPVNFIVHRGDAKDPDGSPDRNFDPAATPEIWLVSEDITNYSSRAEAMGETLVHYHRDDDDYIDWGLHLWQDGSPPFTTWPTRHHYIYTDTFGVVFSMTTDMYPTLELTRGLNFIVHDGMGTQEPQRTYTPTLNYEVWVNADETDWYAQEGGAADFATIHYNRCLGDYGDASSSDFNDFWGVHVWAGAASPTAWEDPVRPAGTDAFGVYYEIPLIDGAPELAYILHRGNEKDVDPDQLLNFSSKGYEIWIVNGDAGTQYTSAAIGHAVSDLICSGTTVGNIGVQSAYWLAEDTIGWEPVTSGAVEQVLYYAADGGMALDDTGVTGGTALTLTANGIITGDIAAKFPHLQGLPAWQIDGTDLAMVPDILRGQIAVAAYDGSGELVDATGLQIPGVLDDLYTYDGALGVSWSATVAQRQAGNSGTPTVRVWAPTAKSVTFHLFDDALPATTSVTTSMTLDSDTGVWSVTGSDDWEGKYYLFEVEVYVHSTGNVENNVVTDPYAVSLSMNSTRSQLVDLMNPTLAPTGWDSLEKPPLAAPEDISVYEIHMRDFSVHDPMVADEDKGTYKAFTYSNTYGINHLQALADSGLTYLHLLPVFDIATINEDKTQWQEPDFGGADMSPDSEDQQAAVTAVEDLDAFNWGYDPFHYNVPEGSYSTVPTGTTRIVEFREMVQAINNHDLRVVMDVVYNHTNASGQNEKSVLDRIVPGYYHRLNAEGVVERSTCCDNTASEHAMMEKLMVDSLVLWATAYKVDAFRFDLMGHHMVSNMEAVRDALDALTIADDGVNGSEIYLYGEGWNFGEVANGVRGENATQLNMAGTGIGTFSDRLRDAVRGGGPFDDGEDLKRQGFANGLYYDPNDHPDANDLGTLLLLSDQVRVGLAGNLAAYAFIDRNGNLVTGADVDYNGQPTGYTEDPQEHIVYISKHDNQTLYDINVYAIPTATNTMTDRIRVQQVGLSIVSLSQGVPFYHAGSDILRSKSLDRDSFNSGDWFNKLDFTYSDNNYGVGLPVASKNQTNWEIMRPFLVDPTLFPTTNEIMHSAAVFEDWLGIRYSTPLFRLQTADAVQDRVAFHNTGPSQVPGVIVMSLSDMVDGVDDLDPNHEFVVVVFNANDEDQTLTISETMGLDLVLHPLQQQSVDALVQTATFDGATGTFAVPGRTTAVFVLVEETATNELEIGSLELLATEPVSPLTSVDFSVMITNTGSLDIVEQFFVDVFINPTEVFTNTIPNSDSSGFVAVGSLGAGESMVVTITAAAGFTNTLALQDVYAMVDSLEQISETVETNNISGPLPVSVMLPPTPMAWLQVVHLAPFASDGAAVDVYLNGTLVLTDVMYAFGSGYLAVPAGEHLAEVKVAGTTATAVSATITLDADSYNSVVAHGGSNGYPLALLALVDNAPGARGPMGFVRVGHLAPFDGVLSNTAVNIVDDSTGLPLLPVSVVYGTISPYIPVPAGEYDLSIELASDGSTLMDLAPFTLSEGESISAFAAGDGVNEAPDVYEVTGEAGALPSLLAPVYELYLPILFNS